jgi:threonine/homoserine/homoserine lactone efflux protein
MAAGPDFPPSLAWRWGGVLYLLWLAWDGWHNDEDVPPPQAHEDLLNIKYFTRGLVTNLLNPKAAMFYVAILPSFITAAAAQGPLLAQTTFLTCVYVGVATLIHGAIVGLAGAARPFLEDPKRRRIARRALSFVLALIALWFAITSGR